MQVALDFRVMSLKTCRTRKCRRERSTPVCFRSADTSFAVDSSSFHSGIRAHYLRTFTVAAARIVSASH